MVFFPVPDEFWYSPNTIGWSAEAYALWILAGSWSCKTLTDGHISAASLALFPPAISAAADELVARGIWRRARGGYQYRSWPKQCTRVYVLAQREAERQKKEKQRAARARDARTEEAT